MRYIVFTFFLTLASSLTVHANVCQLFEKLDESLVSNSQFWSRVQGLQKKGQLTEDKLKEVASSYGHPLTSSEINNVASTAHAITRNYEISSSALKSAQHLPPPGSKKTG